MLQSEIKNELLKINKKALQFVHRKDGFDFTEPCVFTKCEGRITPVIITKTIGAIDNSFSATKFDYKVGLYLHLPHSRYLYFVEFNPVTSEFKPLRVERLPYWIFNVDYFITKGHFEDIRKKEELTTYMIVQKKEYLKPYNEPIIDYTERFNYIKPDHPNAERTYLRVGSNDFYISKIKIKTTIDTGKIIEHKINTRDYKSVDDVIDKSGYLLYNRRNELKNMANKVRQERGKNKVDNADFSYDNLQYKNKIFELKKEISEALNKADTITAIKKVKKAVLSFHWLFNNYTCHIERINEHKYISTNEVVNVLTGFDVKIEEIRNDLKGE